jgi:hypothetical protein
MIGIVDTSRLSEENRREITVRVASAMNFFEAISGEIFDPSCAG